MSSASARARTREEIQVVASRLASCLSKRCNKDGCGLDLTGAPSERVIVDMDCSHPSIPAAGSRCDYVFMGREHSSVCVVPMELKSGGLNASTVLSQLSGGAKAVDSWLSPMVPCRLVPVLVHGKGLHRRDLKVLRSRKVELRGQRRQVQLIRCGGSLASLLRKR